MDIASLCISCFSLVIHVRVPVVSFPSCLRYLNIALMLHLFPKSSTSGSGHLEYMDIQFIYVKNLSLEDNPMHRINHYPADSMVYFVDTYHWIVIYPVNSGIQPSNKWGLLFPLLNVWYSCLFSWTKNKCWRALKEFRVTLAHLVYKCHRRRHKIIVALQFHSDQ